MPGHGPFLGSFYNAGDPNEWGSITGLAPAAINFEYRSTGVVDIVSYFPDNHINSYLTFAIEFSPLSAAYSQTGVPVINNFDRVN